MLTFFDTSSIMNRYELHLPIPPTSFQASVAADLWPGEDLLTMFLPSEDMGEYHQIRYTQQSDKHQSERQLIRGSSQRELTRGTYQKQFSRGTSLNQFYQSVSLERQGSRRRMESFGRTPSKGQVIEGQYTRQV